MKVLFLKTPPSPFQPWYGDFHAALADRFPIEFYDAALPLAEQLRDVCAVVDQAGPFERRPLVEAAVAAKVKLWQVISTGVDNLDVAHFVERGLPLANTPGQFSSIALAEHALFLMLSLAKNAKASEQNVRSRVLYGPPNDELEGTTLGLIGLGASGRELARRALVFGMRIIAIEAVEVPPSVRDELHLDFCGGPGDIVRLLAESDYVSIHVPLNPATRHLIDRRALELMKPTAVLINVARGGIVDQAALTEALRTGRIKGAGLDVFEKEPIDPESPLLRMENVIATQHVAGTTYGTSRRRGRAAAENVCRVAQGEAPLHRVESIP